MKRTRHFMVFQYTYFQLPFQGVSKNEITWQKSNLNFDFCSRGFKSFNYTELCAPKFNSKICISNPCVGTKQNIIVTIKKTVVCYHMVRNASRQLWMIGFSSQTIISKL
jgi:hypothetical protein